ncbi:hypothetical protein C5471_00950 [Photorhabdus tasmaniensis]|uniref:Ferredoxin n=1 Tax=Photorhabdus tasmaniensis TaxID=1004159 RepID=A0ABX0GCH2_9GAMM|nr:hypothetical protein [Photorhabdus tasmaniensis]
MREFFDKQPVPWGLFYLINQAFSGCFASGCFSQNVFNDATDISIDNNNARVFYKDGKSCDIPEHCCLDICVQMPEYSIWDLKQKRLQEGMEGIR